MADLLGEMKRNPQGGWTIKDVETVCGQHGLICSAPKRGSHYKVNRPGYRAIVTVPFKRPIKPVYIRRLVYLIEYGKDGQ
jgi:hypothetical protein